MPKRLTLTLLVYLVAILAVSSLVDGKSFDSVHHRDHDNLKRLIKKRASAPVVVEGVGNEPSSVTESAAGASSSSSVASTSASSSSSSSSAPTSSASSTSSARSSSSSSSTSTSSSSSSSSPSSSSGSSSASSSTSASATTPTTSQASVDASPTPSAVTSIVSGVPVTLTESVAAPSSTPSSGASVTGATASDNSPKAKGITAVIVVASCIGGVAILWTIFRKWKLGRSSKFDARMQPINWQQPTNDDGALPTHRRRASDTSSFHSGIHGNASDMGHGSYGHGSSENGHSAYGASNLAPIPAHDFTAGPAHLAPVGGYADLARGPSPQPQMQQVLARGPSMTRNYDANVPLHHQAGYGGAGY